MTTAAPPQPTEMSGQVIAEAARKMLPVLATRVLTAVADRAVDKVDELAGRLDDLREQGSAADGDEGTDEGDDGGADAAPRQGLSGVWAFLAAQARIVLDLVVRLVAQAAEMLRRATERLRARRAPEGIDDEPADEIEAGPVDEVEDEDEDEVGEVGEVDDEDRATA